MNNLKLIGLFALLICLVVPDLAQAQVIYWMETTFGAPKIGKANFDGSSAQTEPLNSDQLPEGLDIRDTSEGLCWTDLAFTNANVWKTHVTLGDAASLVSGGSALRGIAVDKAGGRMYWTSSNLSTGSKIYRANLDGTHTDTLIDFGTGSNNNLRGIALDAADGKIYWADFDQGTIRRADTTKGATPEDIIIGLGGPVGIAIQASTRQIYWTEANGNTIKRANLNGSGIITLIERLGIPNYICLDTLAGKMYWTEIGQPRIQSADLDGSNVQELPILVSHPAGICVAPAQMLLPIELQTFTAQAQPDGFVRLVWTTLTEVNNYGFEVQRRLAGSPTFKTIPNSFIPGQGTTLEQHTYTYIDSTAETGTLYYRLLQLNLDGSYVFGSEITVHVTITPTGIRDAILPADFALNQNYPNPFNPTTAIIYSLPSDSYVRLTIYNMLGQAVSTPVNGVVTAGNKTTTWNSIAMPSGLYFYRLDATKIGDPATRFSQVRKMTVIR